VSSVFYVIDFKRIVFLACILLYGLLQQRKRDILKAVSVVGDIMKKFDAFLYLSSVSAGIGLIAANLVSVYDVSDYQPAVLSMTASSVVVPELEVVPQTPQAQDCADCDTPSLRARQRDVAGLHSGRVVSNRDLAHMQAPVVPVSGAGVHR
jgi:hypothetical protein